MIPVEWAVTDFDTLVSVIDGDRGVHYPNGDDFRPSGYCLFLNAGNVTKDGFRFLECAFITREKDAQLNKGKLKRNDLVLTTRGTVGNVAYFDAAVPFENIRINSGMVILRNESSSLDTTFLYGLLQSHLVQMQIERLSFGSAQPQLTVKGISKFGIVVPPLPEQRAIAEVLGEVDALLGALTQLIAKKRGLKQATMQQLLTGRTRLPSFNGEWEVRRLGSFARFCAGEYLPQSSYKDGEVQVHGAGNVMGLHDAANYPHPLSVVGRVGTVGRPRFMPRGCWVNNNAAAIIAQNSEATSPYLHALLCTIDWSRVSSVTAQPFLETAALLAVEFALPSLPEQTAIAAVLSDMDAELAALEQRLAKTRALKQGMMQGLLTGKTRLV